MFHGLKVFLTLIPIIICIDYLWIARIMGNFYRTGLSPLIRKQGDTLDPVLWAALMVYICIPLGIVLFVLPRVSQDNMAASALLWGFLFGTVAYGIYDMTNYSLLKDWPLKITIVDMLWGGTLCSLSAFIAAYLDRWYS
jgi:uncharacterized membrane protein